MSSSTSATLIAGIPGTNNTLYHAIRFAAGDPAALIVLPPVNGGPPRRTLIIRDIEADRARRNARVDEVFIPDDFEPAGGFSGDRETATAQSVVECLRRRGVSTVRSDRTLPLYFADALRSNGVVVEYDPELGVGERRAKDAQEVQWLREAQAATEEAMAMACGTIARATARRDGVLLHEGQPLTSERMNSMIDLFLLERGYTTPGNIVAGGRIGADCHDHGHGELRTGEPVIVDIFPRSKATRYNGDCTRTVVHGSVPEVVARMHAAVVEAKKAAIAAIRAGVTGEAVHQATAKVIRARGYEMGFPPVGAADTWCGMVHGTGHGLGLEVHEPPLLTDKGPALVVGDALTVEPGLYCKAVGGIRVEDMVIVTTDGCMNLNRLPEGLTW
jgi:Xaa-Pro aminopeptidase